MTPRFLRDPDRLVALACAAAAVVAALIAQWASHRPGLRLSLLLDVADTDPLAGLIRELDPGFAFSAQVEHYDGVYLYAMAVDPFALGRAHDLIDLAAYRYGHPLYSWIAGALSLGQAPLLPLVFWLLSLGSMASAAYLASRLARRLGASAWWGLVVAMSPGLLFSASTALTEPFQLALACGLILAWMRGPASSPWLIAGLAAAACLAKEQLALVPVALALEAIVRRLLGRGHARERTGRGEGQTLAWAGWSRLAALAAGPLALLAWLAAVRTRFSPDQQAYDSGNIGLPFSQMGELFGYAGQLRTGEFFASQVGTTAPSGIVAIGVILLAGAVAGLARRDALGWTAALQAAVVSGLGWRTLLYPHEMFRIPAVPLALAVLSIAASIAVTRGPRAAPGDAPAPDADPEAGGPAAASRDGAAGPPGGERPATS